MIALLSFAIVFIVGPLPLLMVLFNQVMDVIRHRR